MKTKCPKCGNIQDTQQIKENTDLKTKLFMDFFSKQYNCEFTLVVECKKCGVSFEQDKYLTKEK